MKQKILFLCFFGLLLSTLAKSSCARKYIGRIAKISTSIPYRTKSMNYRFRLMAGLGISAASLYFYKNMNENLYEKLKKQVLSKMKSSQDICLCSEKNDKKIDNEVFIYHIISSGCCALGESKEVVSSIKRIQKHGLLPLNELVLLKDWGQICYEKYKSSSFSELSKSTDEQIFKICDRVKLDVLYRAKSESDSILHEFNYVYFKPENVSWKKYAHVAVRVNPDETYVYNMDVKKNIDQNDSDKCLMASCQYLRSKVLLSDYLRYEKEAKEMEKRHPELKVVMDPETSKPFYLSKNDHKNKMVKVNGEWVENRGVGAGDYNPEVRIFGRIDPSRILVINREPVPFGCCSLLHR